MRRRLAAVLVLTTLAGTMVGEIAGAMPASAQSLELCDAGEGTQFSDVAERDYGAAYILCMKALGLSGGKGDGTYGPDDRLSRAQMASFMIRLWRDVLGGACPDGGHPFEDVNSSMAHAENIGCLYRLGITKGVTATTYGPSKEVTASQISRFLLRLWHRLGNTCPPAATEIEQAGACLTQLHVTPDSAEATSGEPVIRSQMAVYVIGMWHNADGRGAPPAPPARPTDTDPGEGCGLTPVGDWFYETWEDPEYGAAHSWELWATQVTWDRPSQGVGNDCWWDARLSLVCWEDGEWYYSLEWDDLGQAALDGDGYASVYMDPGDPDLGWEGRFPIESTSDDAAYLVSISLLPEPEVEYGWTDYLDYAIAEQQELLVVFPESGERISFAGADGWEEVFDDCEEVLPDTSTGYSEADACRPEGLNVRARHDDVTAGFPLPTWTAATTGTFRVAVLPADFPDARATATDKREVEDNLRKTERYLETMSNERLDVQMFYGPDWITARSGWREYLEPGGALGGFRLSDAIVEEAALSAQQSYGFDGADYDSVMVVLPRSRFGGGLAGSGLHVDQAVGVARWSLVNNRENEGTPIESRGREWWATAAHELTHNLGLADLYPYDQQVRETPDPPENREWVHFEVGLMGLEVNFPAPQDAYPYKVDWPPPYIDQTAYDRNMEGREMLAWSRWQLGWLDEARVACLADRTTRTVELSPAADAGSGIAMVAIPHHAYGSFVIVVESRRSIGYDRPETVSGVDDDGVKYQYTDHALPGEGVIVYRVRAYRESGELPLLLSSDSGDGEVDASPVMTPGSRWWLGEPGTADGQYLIEVLSSTGTTDTIRVTFTP